MKADKCAPCEACHQLIAEDGVCENDDCPMNCEHDDVEDGHCLTCGACLIEDMAAAAYDRAKDSKYE